MTDETQLSEELARRAHHVHGSTLTLDDVRGRARSIKRRRTGAVAGGVAAAVAVVVLVPTVLSGGGGPKSDGVDPAPSSPAGHASVLHDGTLTLPNGHAVGLDVDNADVNQFGVLADGRIVLAMNTQPGVRVYNADGTFQNEYVAGPTAIEMSPDAEAAAWIQGDGTVQVLSSGEDAPSELGTVETGQYTAPLIDAVVDAEHVLVGDGTTTTTEVTTDGVEPLQTSEPLRVTDVSPSGLWAVQYPDDADPQFGCAGVYDPAAATMTARSCETAGLRFSPDGQHVLGLIGDNNMYDHVDVLDLELNDAGTFTPEGRSEVVSRAAWADATHLVVSVVNLGSSLWSLQRVALDGTSAEVVDGPFGGRTPERFQEYLLSE